MSISQRSPICPTSTASSHIYRRMTPDDIAAVVRIDQLAQPSPWPRQQFEQSLAGTRHAWVSVDETPTSAKATNHCHAQAPTITGIAVFSCIAGEAELLTLSIHPKYRRLGLAEGLMSHGIKALTPQHIFLEVRRSNQAAIRLYEKVGLHCIAERHNYYPENKPRNQPKEDALIYAMDFSML